MGALDTLFARAVAASFTSTATPLLASRQSDATFAGSTPQAPTPGTPFPCRLGEYRRKSDDELLAGQLQERNLNRLYYPLCYPGTATAIVLRPGDQVQVTGRTYTVQAVEEVETGAPGNVAVVWRQVPLP